MRTLSVIGKTTTGGAPTEITLVNEPPIGSILSAELLVALHAHDSFQVLNTQAANSDRTSFVDAKDGEGNDTLVTISVAAAGGGTKDFFVPSSSDNAVRKELAVVSETPDADGKIQLTDVNKFKLYLDTGMKVNDTLILKVMIIGEVMRP